MSLINLKPRPLKRDETSLRDDRLFIVACDDTYAPEQYFNFFRIPRVQVHVVPTKDGSSVAKHVLDRLLKYEYEEDDERWMLLDTDHCIDVNHVASFIAALSEARRRGVKIALSKPCFEIWLLLHHVNEILVSSLANAAETEEKLRATLGGQYNKTNLKPEHFPIAKVPDAIQRAKQLDTTVGGGDQPDGNTSRVYLLWEAIVAKALPSQLPPELATILSPKL